VDTMPLETIENFRDHGKVRLSVEDDIQQAKDEFAELDKVGIHYDQITQQLQDEGVQKFADSFHELFKGIESKKQSIQSKASTQ
ncbi:MAG: transaldolase family protein, partial [Ktedonobacteraceae bacterium]